MPKLIVATTLVALVALAACSPSPAGPTLTPSVSPAPSASALPSTPAATPAGTPSAPAATPSPSPTPSVAWSAKERFLLDGVRRGAVDCAPVRDALPDKAVAGIECAADDPGVARIGFYLFTDDADMLDVYMARMTVEQVIIDSGGCAQGEAEGAYAPWEPNETAPYRQGCFVNAEGYANYRATLAGEHVYIGILGRDADTRALEDFAWKGNQDVPGRPTLWAQPSS
jgi:hypothetical protein